MTDDLTLPQALLLLCLNDETGKSEGAFFQPAIAGAALAELLVLKTIELTDDTPPIVTPLRHGQALSTFLRLCDEEIGRAPKPLILEQWINRITNNQGLVATVADELCHMGILSKERSSVFGLFNRTIWPAVSAQVENALKARLAAIMFENETPSPREGALLALAGAAGVLPHNFDADLLAAHQSRIDALLDTNMESPSQLIQIIKTSKDVIVAASVSDASTAATITT